MSGLRVMIPFPVTSKRALASCIEYDRSQGAAHLWARSHVRRYCFHDKENPSAQSIDEQLCREAYVSNTEDFPADWDPTYKKLDLSLGLKKRKHLLDMADMVRTTTICGLGGRNGSCLALCDSETTCAVNRLTDRQHRLR
jgi:hypothetical protein